MTVTTPVGVATITYQQAGRGPDVEAMADAALAVGHSGNPIADAASVVHSAAFGQVIPVVIQVDPNALAQRIQQLVGTSSIAPQNAQATAKGGTFSFTPSTPGHGIDERSMGSTIIDRLTQTSAPADLQAGGTFTTLNPQVTDQDAQDAIALAQKMIVDVNLTWSTPPAAAPSSWKGQSWTIAASQIRSWIVFGTRQDGTYGPAVDPAQVEAYLSSISAKVSIAPVEPKVVWDSSGKPVNLTPGTDGVGIDLAGTTQALSAYLDTLATGGTVGPSLEVLTTAIHPQIANVSTVAGMVIIGQHTTQFYRGREQRHGRKHPRTGQATSTARSSDPASSSASSRPSGRSTRRTATRWAASSWTARATTPAPWAAASAPPRRRCSTPPPMRVSRSTSATPTSTTSTATRSVETPRSTPTARPRGT